MSGGVYIFGFRIRRGHPVPELIGTSVPNGHVNFEVCWGFGKGFGFHNLDVCAKNDTKVLT